MALNVRNPWRRKSTKVAAGKANCTIVMISTIFNYVIECRPHNGLKGPVALLVPGTVLGVVLQCTHVSGNRSEF